MFNIKFENAEQINVVLAGLSKLPYEFSATLIDSVRKQAQEQVPQPQEKAGLSD